jgi:type IX secretion system PorP/SprF family membrane protein
MKRFSFLLLCNLVFLLADGQSIHFSQYYNAPMLINPANTGLMPDYDYRLGLNYRNQWAIIPVPYNTFSGYADCKVGGNNQNKTSNNWLGIGFTYYFDEAGNGNLSLSQIQLSLAYHLQLNEFSMLSLGFSGASVNRSVNYDLLTFNNQWDGFTFNPQLATGEKGGIIQTSYYTGAAGLNFAWFPSEFVYIKLGGGVANINQPIESFYGASNQIKIRPTANLDMFFHVSDAFVINPSAYFTTQSAASQLVAGALTRTNLGGVYDNTVTQLILGGFMRVGDAVIGVVGFQFSNVQFMVNYDMTISGLAPYNDSYGALEFSLIYQGLYNKNKNSIKKSLGCPRFF